MTASTRQRTDIGITTGWKRHRPGLELGLTVLAACFIPLAVAVTTGAGGGNKQSREVREVSEHGDNGDTCFTAACNDTATMILNNMDRSVDPCDNFYRYACGKVYEQLRAIVEAEIEPNEPKAYKLVKKYYKSCVNMSAIEARGVQPLLANLRRMGGWPMIEGTSWNESNFEWTKAIYELRESGHYFRSIMTMYVVSQLNGTEPKIHIVPPEPLHTYGFPTEDFFNQLSHRSRKSLIYMAIRLGAQNNTSTQDLEETTKFIFNLLKMKMLN